MGWILRGSRSSGSEGSAPAFDAEGQRDHAGQDGDYGGEPNGVEGEMQHMHAMDYRRAAEKIHKTGKNWEMQRKMSAIGWPSGRGFDAAGKAAEARGMSGKAGAGLRNEGKAIWRGRECRRRF